MISVITPFYKGNKHLENYSKNLYAAINNLNCPYKVEIIFINDSPEEEIDISKLSLIQNQVKIITNKKNRGIHYSRIRGLKVAQGNYILFLDQDDLISKEFFNKTISKMSECDIVVCNGHYEKKDYIEKIYRNSKTMNYISDINCMAFYRNLIISPGQCLIKKTCIPTEWINYTISINGADDYLLWLLLLNNHNINWKFIFDPLYMHSYSGDNLSLDENKMRNSVLEMCEYLIENTKNPIFNNLKKILFLNAN